MLHVIIIVAFIIALVASIVTLRQAWIEYKAKQESKDEPTQKDENEEDKKDQ